MSPGERRFDRLENGRGLLESRALRFRSENVDTEQVGDADTLDVIARALLQLVAVRHRVPNEHGCLLGQAVVKT